MKQIPHYWAGERTLGESARRARVFDPASGEAVAEAPLASVADVQAAVAAAQAAWPAGGDAAVEAARVMFRFKEILEARQLQLAECISREHWQGDQRRAGRGHPWPGGGGVCLRHSAFAQGRLPEEVGSGIDSYATRQPLGWWPASRRSISGHGAAVDDSGGAGLRQLLCAQAVRARPSASLLLADWLAGNRAAGQGVQCAARRQNRRGCAAGPPDVQAVSFVGSTPIARYIYDTGAHYGKRVQALGRAKNHMVVMPDADLELTVDALMGAAYGSAGERCMAISVALAVGEVGDALVAQLAERVRALKVNAGTAPDAEMGPLITAEHRAKVTGYIDSGVAEGAQLVVDGRALSVPGCEQGFFLGGTLFDHVTPEMTIYREEIFGPVLAVVRVASFEQALQLINDHPYGNGTSLFTRDGATARAFAHRVQAGMVGVNVPIPVPMAFHSFGGWKSLFVWRPARPWHGGCAFTPD